jgi:hypothetical protein
MFRHGNANSDAICESGTDAAQNGTIMPCFVCESMDNRQLTHLEIPQL